MKYGGVAKKREFKSLHGKFLRHQNISHFDGKKRELSTKDDFHRSSHFPAKAKL
jgi:hypothetical protein